MLTDRIQRLRIIIFLLSLVILILTLGFNSLLSVSALDRLASDTILSAYKGNGLRVVKVIERGMRFGKPLAHYAGMDDVLRDFHSNIDGVERVQVRTPQGEILYSLPKVTSGALRSEVAGESFDVSKLKGAVQSQELPDGYRILIPLHHKGLVGVLVIDVSKKTVEASSRRFSQWTFALLFACCILVGIMLVAWIGLLTNTSEARVLLGKSLVKLLLILIGGTQLVYLMATVVLFSTFAEEAMQTRATMIAQSVKRDFEYLVHKGVDVQSLKGLDAQLAQILETNPELVEASLLRPDNSILAHVGTHSPDATAVEETVDAYWPSRFQQRQDVLRIRLSLDPSALSEKVVKLVTDLLTALVISLLLLFELAKLLSLISTRINGPTPALSGEDLYKSNDCARSLTLRAAAFLFFLGYDMGISFVPMLAQKLYVPMWGFSEEVITGLPISFEMLFAGLALLLAGSLAERFGWQRAFVLGAAFATTGLALAGFADSLPLLVLARAVAGFGFGIVLMTAQIATLGNGRAGSDMANLFAGVFAGSICGSAAGAMLADRFGYEAVFFTAAVLIPLCILVLPLSGKSRKGGSSSGQLPVSTGLSGYWMFVKNPRMLNLLLLVGIPVAICLTGFLHYQLPLLLHAADVEQSDIGRVFMLYGLCFVTVGAFLGKWIDRTQDTSHFAMLAALLSGIALLVAATCSGLVGAALAVACLGVSQCIAAPATMISVVHFRVSQQLGKEKTASVYRTLERIGQVLGPILFGSIVVVFGTSQALFVMGGAICGMAVLFWLVNRFNIFQD